MAPLPCEKMGSQGDVESRDDSEGSHCCPVPPEGRESLTLPPSIAIDTIKDECQCKLDKVMNVKYIRRLQAKAVLSDMHTCFSLSFIVRNPFAPYRRQNRRNREKRVSESTKTISCHPSSESKNPHFWFLLGRPSYSRLGFLFTVGLCC